MLARYLAFLLAGLAALLSAIDTPSALAQGRGVGGAIDRGPMIERLQDVTDRVGRLPEAASRGLERATDATSAAADRVSPQIERGRQMMRTHPDLFETDRHGALAIRGEIVAIDMTSESLAAARQAGFTVLRETQLEDLGISVTTLLAPKGTSSSRALRRLRKLDPNGRYDHNHVYFGAGRTVAADQGAAAGQKRAQGRMRVGLVDTDIAVDVPQLRHVAISRRNFVGTTSAPAEHGTAVAALLAEGSAAPGDVSLFVADIYGNSPRGGTAELLARALGWLAREQVPVINASVVGPPNTLLQATVQALTRRGHVIVAPVGNNGAAARPLYPASYPEVIAVSAADERGRILPEASRVKQVDFVAPGIARVPDTSGRLVTVRGTSFAAPIIARRFAAHLDEPDPKAAERVRKLLVFEASANAPMRRGGVYGHGLIGPEKP